MCDRIKSYMYTYLNKFGLNGRRMNTLVVEEFLDVTSDLHVI